MNWMTITWPMIAAACLTLGLIELNIGLAQPTQRAARVLFALSAFTVACISGLELAIMRTATLTDWWPLMRGLDIAVGMMMVFLTAFIWVYFGTGNRWLALAVPCLYAAGLVFDYLPGAGMTYQSITGLRTVGTFGGASFNVIDGVSNPWNVFPYLAVIALVVFVINASVKFWHCGKRRGAVMVGGSVVVFFLTGGTQAALIEMGCLDMPYMISWPYLVILLAMARELNADVLAAAKLSQELQASEQRMELAGAAANLGMWSLDAAQDTIWANPRARDLLGFSESEPLNLARFLCAVHPDDRDTVTRTIETALATEHQHEAQYRISLPGRRTRWIAARGQVERNPSGKPVRLHGVLLDNSAHQDSEIQMQELRSQLTHVARVSMLGQLASALAHELSQPLGAILRNTEAAELFLQHDPPDLDELRAILLDIRYDDQRAGKVIERLRVLLKRRSIDSRSVLMDELLVDVAALVRLDTVVRHIQFGINAAPTSIAVMGDSVQLQQVLLNLILNAMDAVEAIPAERRTVTVGISRHNEREAQVAVSDTGNGIAPDELQQLFEPFFTTKSNGLGIGLSISRTIIEAHGGRIWAENNAGEGATFRFTLPLAGAGAAGMPND